MSIFTGHTERRCENASQELAADETETVGAGGFLCERVRFKAIDLALGNMFCLLTGAGYDAISQVIFPLQELSLTQSITLCFLLCFQLPLTRCHRQHGPN